MIFSTLYIVTIDFPYHDLRFVLDHGCGTVLQVGPDLIVVAAGVLSRCWDELQLTGKFMVLCELQLCLEDTDT